MLSGGEKSVILYPLCILQFSATLILQSQNHSIMFTVFVKHERVSTVLLQTED